MDVTHFHTETYNNLGQMAYLLDIFITKVVPLIIIKLYTLAQKNIHEIHLETL